MGLWPTEGDEKRSLFSNFSCWKRPSSLCHLDRSVPGISYFATLAKTTCAVSLKRNRMQIIKATGLDRKSGGAQWRDLRFSGPFLEMFFDRANSGRGVEVGNPDVAVCRRSLRKEHRTPPAIPQQVS